jgi:hypothetical protein
MSTAVNRAPRGRFAPGTSGNVNGRPSVVRQTIEQGLKNLGATAAEVEMVKRAATGSQVQAAAAMAMLVAAVTLRQEDANDAAA